MLLLPRFLLRLAWKCVGSTQWGMPLAFLTVWVVRVSHGCKAHSGDQQRVFPKVPVEGKRLDFPWPATGVTGACPSGL